MRKIASDSSVIPLQDNRQPKERQLSDDNFECSSKYTHFIGRVGINNYLNRHDLFEQTHSLSCTKAELTLLPSPKISSSLSVMFTSADQSYLLRTRHSLAPLTQEKYVKRDTRNFISQTKRAYIEALENIADSFSPLFALQARSHFRRGPWFICNVESCNLLTLSLPILFLKSIIFFTFTSLNTLM